MGNFSSSNLPELAYLGVRAILYPMVGAMWYNNKTNTGWAIALTYAFFWWLIAVGFNLSDPLVAIAERLGFSGLKIVEEAAVIYEGIYPVIMLFSGFLGALICGFMDIREISALYTLFPTMTVHNIVSTKCNPIDIDALKEFLCMCERGLERLCYTHLPRPYEHTIVGLLLSLFTLTLPDFLFSYFVATNKWTIYGACIAIRVVGYLAAWLYWSYRTNLYAWGPTEWNTRMRRASVAMYGEKSPYIDDPNIDRFDTFLFAETQSVINKNVLTIALIDIVGFVLIGGVIVVPSVPDIDVVIGTGIAYLVIVFLIFGFIYLYFYQQHGGKSYCPKRCPRGFLLNASLPPQTPLSSNSMPLALNASHASTVTLIETNPISQGLTRRTITSALPTNNDDVLSINLF